MTHIETTCKEEKDARNDFKDIEKGDPVVADEALEKTVRDLLALRHKMDEDALEASKMKAAIMKAMGHRDTLKSKDGTLLVSWNQGSTKSTVDYKGLLAKYKVKVSNEDLKAFTTTKVGSRVFNLELD